MKKKLLSQEEFKKTFKLGERLSFYPTSPFSEITDPKGIIFIASHWNPPMLIGATGTAYVCREGNNVSPFKFDVLSFHPKNGSTEISHVQIKKIDYHHTKNIPPFIKEQAPHWVSNRIQEVIKKFKSTE